MKMVVVWVFAPCSLVDVYRRFRGTFCLHQVITQLVAGDSKHL
jgi:hypothetical protein